MEESNREKEPEVNVPKLDIPDLRQILKRQDEPRAKGLFSAADFIALDDDETEAPQAHEGAREGVNHNGMHTERGPTGTMDEQEPLTTDVASGDTS